MFVPRRNHTYVSPWPVARITFRSTRWGQLVTRKLYLWMHVRRITCNDSWCLSWINAKSWSWAHGPWSLLHLCRGEHLLCASLPTGDYINLRQRGAWASSPLKARRHGRQVGSALRVISSCFLLLCSRDWQVKLFHVVHDELKFTAREENAGAAWFHRSGRRELSSPALTLGSWVRIPLETWISTFIVFVLYCV